MKKRAINSMLATALTIFAVTTFGAVLPQLPEPVFADTEVSTNIPFNTARSDAREFGVEMSFTGTASNCVQVAFGRDSDGDGDLSPEETAFALGWRGGAYFIEDVARGERLREDADMSWAEARSLSLHVALDSAYRPRSAAATNESGACFLPVTSVAPDWLYGAEWNLMKVTRRGVDATAEAVAVDCRYRFFVIRFM